MTNDEAASILYPATRWEALEKYERDYCLEGIVAIQAACDEACCLAVEALRTVSEPAGDPGSDRRY